MRGRIQKILILLNQKLNFDSKYTHISGNYISQALESLMCQKLKMLHNFWLMDQKLFWLGSMHTEFNADSDAKWVFSKFSIFQVNIPLRNFELNFAIFRKLRGQKKSKFHFLGQFLTLKNMVTKFFRNSNFSDFLGIKSEINQWIFSNDTSLRRIAIMLVQPSFTMKTCCIYRESGCISI